MSERETGTVKWFDERKGYGFIHRDNGDDIFVHYSQISGTGVRSLQEGERVEFSVGQGRKGPAAEDVRKIQAAG
jgi:CspA family cold shock protein